MANLRTVPGTTNAYECASEEAGEPQEEQENQGRPVWNMGISERHSENKKGLHRVEWTWQENTDTLTQLCKIMLLAFAYLTLDDKAREHTQVIFGGNF